MAQVEVCFNVFSYPAQLAIRSPSSHVHIHAELLAILTVSYIMPDNLSDFGGLKHTSDTTRNVLSWTYVHKLEAILMDRNQCLDKFSN